MTYSFLVKYGEIVGIPVLCEKTGRIVGRTEDIIFSCESMEVVALAIKNIDFLSKKNVIRTADIKSIGRDAVVVGEDCRKSLKELGIHRSIIKKGEQLLSKKVYTADGRNIGFVNDMLFNCEIGRIEGFEISNGLVEDLISGRNIIPIIGNCMIGNEGIFISRESGEEIINDGKGIVNLLKAKDEHS